MLHGLGIELEMYIVPKTRTMVEGCLFCGYEEESPKVYLLAIALLSRQRGKKVEANLAV